MTKKNYIDALIRIGYTEDEALHVINTTAWSMVQLEDTVRCNRKLYDLNGKVA